MCSLQNGSSASLFLRVCRFSQDARALGFERYASSAASAISRIAAVPVGDQSGKPRRVKCEVADDRDPIGANIVMASFRSACARRP